MFSLTLRKRTYLQLFLPWELKLKCALRRVVAKIVWTSDTWWMRTCETHIIIIVIWSEKNPKHKFSGYTLQLFLPWELKLKCALRRVVTKIVWTSDTWWMRTCETHIIIIVIWSEKNPKHKFSGYTLFPWNGSGSLNKPDFNVVDIFAISAAW